ncbi:MAG: hypothetical protein ACI9KS_001557 [Sulfitobacter sp.]|jgi:hypothetical protein
MCCSSKLGQPREAKSTSVLNDKHEMITHLEAPRQCEVIDKARPPAINIRAVAPSVVPADALDPSFLGQKGTTAHV